MSRRLVLWLDHVRKSANIGAITRLAAAFEAELVLSGVCGTPLGGRFAAVGYEAPTRQFPDFETARTTLSAEGLTLIGTSPRFGTPCTDIAWDDDVAIVFGNEVGGLGKHKLEVLDAVTHIPMPGAVESLNVATAVAILAFQVRSSAS